MVDLNSLPLPLPPKPKKRKTKPRKPRKVQRNAAVEVTPPSPVRSTFHPQGPTLQDMAIDLGRSLGSLTTEEEDAEASSCLTKLYHMDELSIPYCPVIYNMSAPPTLQATQERKSRSISLPASSESAPSPRSPSTLRKQKSTSSGSISAADFEPVSISASDFEPVPNSVMNSTTTKNDELSRFVNGLDWKSLYQKKNSSQPGDCQARARAA